MTSVELKKLRKSLPNDYAKRLSEKFGHTPSYIYLILKGTRKNIFVLKAAVEMAEEWKREQELEVNSLSHKIKNL